MNTNGVTENAASRKMNREIGSVLRHGQDLIDGHARLVEAYAEIVALNESLVTRIQEQQKRIAELESQNANPVEVEDGK